MNQPSSEKRHYQRIPFIKASHLVFGETQVPGQILDISIKGALFKPDAVINTPLPEDLTLIISLDGSTEVIEMKVKVIPHSSDLLGLECHHIEIDSFTNLKNTLKYNLGDDALLDRQMNALLDNYQG